MEPNEFTRFESKLSDAWMVLGGRSFEGLTVNDVIICIMVLAAAFVMRRAASAAVVARIGMAMFRSRGEISDAVMHGLAPAIRFVPFVIAAFVIAAVVPKSALAQSTSFAISRSLVAFVLFWALFGVVPPIFQQWEIRRVGVGDAMVSWAVRVSRIIIFCLGAGAVLEIWNIHIGPVLAGLGLAGAAVALGAQDLFKNLIGGVFIIGEQRFENGDWIRVEGIVEGTVETIGLRASKIRQFDLAPVYVPNSKLSDNALTNFSKMTSRRISWIIGLEYSTTVDQLRRIRDEIQAHIDGSDAFVHSADAPTFVRIDSFGDSSINMMVYCFTRTTDWGEWLKVKEAFAYEVKEVVERAGSGFAFPSRSLYVETVPAGAEIFPLSRPAQNQAPVAADGAP